MQMRPQGSSDSQDVDSKSVPKPQQLVLPMIIMRDVGL